MDKYSRWGIEYLDMEPYHIRPVKLLIFWYFKMQTPQFLPRIDQRRIQLASISDGFFDECYELKYLNNRY